MSISRRVILRVFSRLATALAVLIVSTASGARAVSPCVRDALAEQLLNLHRSGFDTLDAGDTRLLRAGETSSQRVYLRAGVIYAVVAGGCDDALDIDLTLHGPAGDIVTGHVEHGRRASLVILADRTGFYTVSVTMWEAAAPGAHYSMLVAH